MTNNRFSRLCGPAPYLIQLPAEALKDVVLVDLENGLSVVEEGVHDHAQRVHVGGTVAADGQDVLGRQILGVGEAEWGEVGFPFFARVPWLKGREDVEGKERKHLSDCALLYLIVYNLNDWTGTALTRWRLPTR